MTNPQVLLYNFTIDDRAVKLGRWLTKEKIPARIVQAPEFLHPLGFLFEIPGFQPNPQFNLGGNFHDEMIVLKDFSDAQLDGFLRFFRENQLAPIKLKAVLTPVTQYWNSLELHKELTKEHEAMEGRKRP